MSTVMLRFAASLLVLIFIVEIFCYAPPPAAFSSDEDLVNKPLENVQIEGQGVEDFFARLSLSYDIPIGLEVASKDSELASYSLNFKKGKLSDLLAQFVKEHHQYAWKITDGVVRISPKEHHRDLLFDRLLKTKISNFSIKEKTDCWTIAKALAATPEIKRILQMNRTSYRQRNFSGPYIPQAGRNFSLNVSNMSLEAILNKVVKESPTAKFWHISRNNYDQTLFVGLNARHEDSKLETVLP